MIVDSQRKMVRAAVIAMIVAAADVGGAAAAGWLILQSRQTDTAVQELTVENESLRKQVQTNGQAQALFVEEIDFICKVSEERARESNIPIPSPDPCDLGAILPGAKP